MRSTFLSACAGVFMLASMAVADVSFFTNPPRSDDSAAVDFSQNPVFTKDDLINLQWSSSFVNVSLLLEQYNNDFRPVLIDNKPNPGVFPWTVSYNEFTSGPKINNSTVMRFVLYDAPTQNHIYSHFFNLTTPPPVVSSSSFSATPTPTQTPIVIAAPINTSKLSTFTTLTTPSRPTSTSALAAPSLKLNAEGASMSSTGAPAASPSSAPAGLDANTAAGLGVGLGVGIPLLGVLAAIFFILRRKTKDTERLPSTAEHWQHHHKASYASTDTAPSTHGFAMTPEHHAVPILQPPPAARYVNHPTNENGYAPPSATLKPWTEAMLMQDEHTTRTYDAYGRPMGEKERQFSEAEGDNEKFRSGESGTMQSPTGVGALSPKELPALPSTPAGTSDKF